MAQLTNDYPVEKLYRDARVFQIYDGTNEVQKILISLELAQRSAAREGDSRPLGGPYGDLPRRAEP